MLRRWLERRRTTRRRGPRARAEPLEPRILYSADLLAGALPDPPTPDAGGMVRDAGLDVAPSGAAAPAADPRALELVVVDAGVPDAQRLVDAIAAQRPDASLRIVLLDATRDGLAQIGEALASMSGVSAVHLLAHGEPGAVVLSGRTIDAVAVDAVGAGLAAWREALTADADLLVYGCDLAASDAGIDLMARLARWTGADVAASEDATGSADAGGDWTLEAATGAIEARTLFAGADPAGWSGRLQVVASGADATANTTTAGVQTAIYSQRAVAVAADGSSLVVWHDATGAGDIFARRYDASGAAVGSEFQVNTTTAAAQSTPEVAVGGDGHWWVVWASVDQDAAGTSGIYAQRYAADGSALGGEFRVNTTTAGDQSLPSIAVDASGDAVIVWQHGTGTPEDIRGQRFDATGTAQGGEFTVNTVASTDPTQAKVAMDASGRFVVTWQNTNQDGDGAGIFARRYDASGTALGAEFQVNQTTAGDQALPDIAMNADGFVVAWMSDGEDGSSWGILARRYDATGTAAGNAFLVNTTTAADQRNPQIAMTAGGGFVVTWDSNGQDGDQMGVYLRQFAADDVALTGETRVNDTTAGYQAQSSVAVNAAGDLVVAYTGNQGGTDDVWVRRWSLSEELVVTVTTTADTVDGTTTSVAALLAAPGGDGAVSLREAILAANATGGAQTIRFAIPPSDPNYSGGVFTITLASLLPQLTSAMTLDGTTQTTTIGETNPGLLGTGGTVGVDALALGQVARPEIEIVDGGSVSIGLDLAAAGITVRGLAMQGFDVSVLRLRATASNALVEGNVLGGRATTFTDPGSGARSDTIVESMGAEGGTLRNNLIGFADQNAVALEPGSDRWTVTGNEVRGGSLGSDILNAFDLQGADAVVRGNLFADTRGSGIDLRGTTSNALFQNNTVSNIGYGVSTEGHSLAVYGSATATIDRNVIRDAPQNAIRVSGTAQAVITRNAIDGSGGLGIELGYDGVTANDALDADTGPNGLQNHPVLLSAVTDGTDASLTGTLSSAASTTYRLEFFSSPVADASGHGEGRTYLGSLDVTTDASGEASFSTTLSGVGLAGGHAVTATATRMSGATAVETSEFAASVAATGAPVIVTSGGSLAYTEGDGAAAIDPGLTVSDVDSATLAGATVRISVNFASGQDVLAFVDQNGITGSWNAGTGTLTLSGTATRAQYETALRSVTYRNTSDAPSTATRTIAFVANDGALDSAAVVRTITVAPEADTPTDIDLAGAAGTNLLVNGSFEDNPGAPGAADYPMSLPGWTPVGPDPLEVWNSYDQGGPGTASAGQALLEIDSFGSLNGVAQTVTTTAGQTYVLSFDLSNRTPSAVSGLEVYWRGELVATVTQSAVAWRTHAFVVTGSGGADELRFVETAATNDSVGPLLDDVRLVAARTPAISVAEGAANGTAVAIAGRADLDVSSDATVTWSLVDDAGGRFAIDAASGRITVALGSALDHEAGASHSIIVRVEDSTGLSRQESFTIAVADAEEATVNTLPTDRYTPVDTSLVFGTAGGNAIGVTDGDTGPLRITLAVDTGTLTLAATTGLAFTAGDGTADTTMTFTGTQAEVAAALDGLVFTPTGSFRGLATITVTSEDAGGTSTDTDTVRVHVGAIVVTTTSDVSNGDTSSFAALAASNGGDGVSLREAIELTNAVANATGQVDHIRFAIATPRVDGVHTIAVASALPGITDAVDLDASTEPDFAGTPVIELDGTATASAPDNTGIRLLGGSSGSTIRGLVINRFGDDGLLIWDSSDNTIAGNVIGTDAAGTVDLGNEQDGVIIGGTSTNNTIGGTAAADRNRIAGNDLVGVRLTGAAVTGNRVLGNTIGIDGGGTTIGQGADGVVIQAGAWGNTIGGAAPGSGNTIAASAGAGILVAADAGTGNTLLRNAIGTSTGLGIDLGGDGVTSNDALDADTGPNDLQNAPVLLEAATTGTAVRLRGSLDAAASTEYRIEFHAIAAGAEDASGHGEGGVFLVAVTVTTDAAGHADFDFATVASVPAGDRVTATATVSLGGGVFGSTSEFAMNVVATGVPTLTASGGPLAWAEGDGAVAIDPGLMVADADSATLAGATVVIATNHASGEDVLAFTDQSGITGSWNSAAGTLTLTGTATVAQYQAALRSITYANTSDAPSTLQRVVSFTVTDGTATSAAATRAIDVTAVNDAPTVTASGTPLAYTENDGAVAVDPGLVIADADDATLAGATVAIVTNHASAEDMLAFTDQAGITGSWNAATGTLTLTGTATVVQYQAALRSITYTNTSDGPSTLQRVVSFTVDDGTSTSTASTRAIDVTAVNDAPTVTASGTPLAYTENDGAVAVDPGLVIADADDATLAGATVAIVTNHASGEDVLAFTDQAGITGSWNAATGTLTLTGTATVVQYQAALRSITYTNTNDGPSTLQRVVSFTVDDGTANSTAATRAIDVTAAGDAPTVTTGSGALAYAENDGAVSIDPGLVVADADSTTLAGATVVIATNYSAGEDVLAFTDQAGITGSWNGATGTLTLTGAATVAQYQAALRSITYTNANDAPSTLQRVVSFTVDDGTSTSAAATRAIDVTSVNDTPTVTPTGTLLSYTENDGAVAVDDGLVLDDLDHTTLSGATVRIVTNHASGEDLMAFTDQAGITGSWNGATGTLTLTGTATLAQYEAALRSITYTNTSDALSTLQRVVSFTVTDGTSTSIAATRAIDVTPVNDAPTVTTSGTPLAYTENAGATAVDAGLGLADADGATITGATVTIVTNHEPGEDVLAFTDQAGITGSWNAATGTLTLTGTATIAQYQAALRTVTYTNTSDAPSTLARTIEFVVVDDGTATSAAASRTITVAAANDPPVVTTTSGALAYAADTSADAVDAGLVVTDVDSATLAGATIRITTNYANGEDLLGFTDQAGITGTWNATTATLTLSGSASIAQYEAALRSVTYTNGSGTPSTAQRVVSFTVDDGTASSAAATRAIDVNLVNRAPAFGGLDATVRHVPGTAPVVMDADVTVTDVELDALGAWTGATLTLQREGGASADDAFSAIGRLGALTAGGPLTLGGTTIGTVSTNAGGVLVLTFGAAATPAAVEEALRSLAYAYVGTLPAPDEARIAWTIDDGNTGAQGPGGARQGTGVSVVALTGVPGITVTPPASTTTAETGTSVTFSVVLDARPLDTVTISVSIGNPLEGRVSTTQLVFGPGDWNVAQQVVVTGVDDTVVDGTRTYTIVFGPAVSTDSGYAGLDPADVTITNIDDDVVSTIAVTTESDVVDGTVTSLAALWANRGADGEVSLREAILAANAGADGPGGIDRIVFDIAGTGEHVIALASVLPTIDHAVSIDASTDDSFAAAGGAPAVRLDGGGTVDDGLRLGVGADGSSVRGLAFTGFVDAGIEIAGSGGHAIVGNAIGPGAGGAGSGNAIGISVTASSGTRIGGTAAGDGNTVSGNDVGLRLGAGATGTPVLGNRIGTDAAGTTAAGNGSTGVLIVGGASNNTIGGRTAAAANVIAANGGDGIVLSDAGTSGNRIEGNRIGELADGSTASGNTSAGVRIDSGATGNTIGGTAAGAGNRIAGNGGAGIVLTADAGTGNAILGNAIRANAGAGIDLGDDGITPNDALDADSGANALQNFPVPTLARTDGAGTVSVTFEFESSPNRYYRVEFFAVAGLDAGGHGEGARYLGHVDVVTDASGRASATATLSATVAVGEFVTATATRTDATGTTMLETSEFSRGIVAIDATQASLVVDGTSDDVDGDVTSLSTLLADRGADGRISLREALLAANATANGSLGADRIRFDLPGSGPATIVLAADLPAITDAIVIDGTSDPDWSGPGGPPVVIIDGAESVALGLDLRDGADGSTIRGLLIRNVTYAGIEIRSGSDGHLIAGNRIGAFDAAGQPITTAQASYGILVYGANVTVGGIAAADANLIAGAGESAVAVWGPGASGAVVIGNRIGVAADGITSIGNGIYGVRVAAGASGVRIGGTDAGEGNTIVASGSAGVLVDGSGGGSSASILGNRFVESGSLDIDLSTAAYDDGPTANDVGDADSGGNGLLNTPVLTAAVRNGTTLEITGTLDAAPSTTYRIEVFTSPIGAGNASGYGASTLLTALEVTTDASGHAVISVSIAAPSVADGDDIGATATVKLGAGWGATSEFAANVQVEPYTAPPTLVGGGGTPTYIENAPAVALDPGLVVGDLDSPTLASATVTIVANYDGGRDRLVFVGQAGISGDWDAVSGTLHLYGDASVADWQAVLRSVAFEHVGENPSGAARTIEFVVFDAEGGNESVPLTLSLAVTPVADPPTTPATFALARTNTPSLPVVLRGNDLDDAVVAIRLTSLPTDGLLYVDAGQLTLAAVGVDYATAGQSVTMHFVPATDWVGTTTFEFAAVDASGLADPSPATATITIGDNVDPPVAVTDAFAVDEDNDLIVDADGVLANDVATGGRALVATLVTGPASAAVFALNEDGSFVYRPRPDFNGTDTFTYLASDGVGDSNVVTVTLTVNALNDAPILADAVLPAVAEDVTAPTGSTIAALLGPGFSDPDAGAFLAGALVIYDDQYGDPSAGVWEYSTDGGTTWHAVGPVAPETSLALDATARLRFLPAPDWNGAPSPLYVLALDDTWTGGFTAGAVRVTVDDSTLPEDGAASFDWATISTQVTPVNDAPVILSNGGDPIVSVTVEEGDPDASDLDAYDVDLPVQRLTWSIVGGADAARFEVDAAGGLLRFLEAPDFERPADVGGDNVYTVVVELSDGIATVRQSITVTVTNVAEAPTVSAPARVLATEDVPLTIAGLSLADGDGDITRLDIGVDAGTLDVRLDGGARVVGGALGSRSLTLAGTQAQLGAALATLGYRGGADYAGNDQLRIVATDATGLSSGTDVAIAVAPVNDAPTLLRNLGIEVAEGASVTLADSRLSFADVDDSPGAVLIRLDTAPVAGELRVAGTVLGAGGLFSQADLLAGRVVYLHRVPGTTADSLVLSAADDDGLRTAPIAVSITIDAVNDPPRWVAPTAVITFEDTAVVFDDASNRRILAIDDADRNALLELRLQVGPGATLSLARLDGLTMISAGDGAGAPIVFRATLFDANRALAGLRLDPVANFTGTTALTLTIDDLGATGSGGPQSTTTTVSVTVAPVNDAPTLIVPGAQTVAEDTPLSFGTSGTARILIADSDAVGLLTLSLAVDAGTLTLGSTEGLALLAGDGTADSVIVVRGTVARLQAAVDGLRFTPSTDFTGPAAFDLIADDGQGGTVQRRVAIEVTPVDDPAGALTPGAQQVRSDRTLGFGPATGNAIQVRDVDGAPGGVTVELQVGRGALRVDAVAGVTLAAASDGGAGMRLRLDGSLDAINRALATLVYQPVADWWGTVELRVVVLGGDGSTPISTKSVSIGVLPLATGPSTAGAPVAPGAAAGAPVAAPTAADPGAAARGASSAAAVGDVLAPRTVGTRTAIASNSASVQARSGGTPSAEASALLDANADAGAAGVVPRSTAFATMAGRAVEGGGSGGTAASASASAADPAWLLISADRIALLPTPQSVDPNGLREVLDAGLAPAQAVRGDRGAADAPALEVSLVQGAQVVGVALTAGTLWWAIYGGTTLWILLATGPLARTFDPLPVLMRDDDDGPRDAADAMFEEGEDEPAPDAGTPRGRRDAKAVAVPA